MSQQTETKINSEIKMVSKNQGMGGNSGNFRLGLSLVLISSLMLSFQNVVTKVILFEKDVLGVFKMGGILAPGLENSLLLMFMRMAFTFPVMAFIVAPRIYKNTWKDIGSLTHYTNRTKLYATLGSAFCLFASQLSIYVALGSVPTGVATTIFFVYPTITILLVWLFYGEKPPVSLVFAMLTIYIGGFMTVPETAFSGRPDANNNYIVGGIAALLSGTAFAGYMILIKTAKMHPAPFTVVNFFTILVLSGLLLPQIDLKLDKLEWVPFLIGTGILSVTTLVGYLLNNFGVPLIGPSLTSVIGSSGPALTTMLAYLLISEKLNLYQVIGVFLVTLWVLGISVENMKKNSPPPPAKT
jgi:drug/metabolite transporter (DMT)-like permease